MDEPQKPDWRWGFVEHEHEWVLQIEDWRERGVEKSFQLSNGDYKFPADMDDGEIRDAAREMARRDMDRAINEYNSLTVEARRDLRENELYRELTRRKATRQATRLLAKLGTSEPQLREIAREVQLPIEKIRELAAVHRQVSAQI